ncbi:MAG: endopeptidase La [Clostridia bacterium]|nr:endopeptidase La [Clostridia bacterium]
MERNSKVYENIPVVPLRGLVVLPGELLHFDAGRQGSIKALTAAGEKDNLVFLTSQKDVRKNDVGEEDIYRIGTICRIRQTLNLPGDTMRVLVYGICRARFTNIRMEGYLTADAISLDPPSYDETEAEALRRRLASALGEFAALSAKLSADTAETISHTADVGAFADAVANVTLGKTEQRQQVLECFHVPERLRTALSLVLDEIEILRVDRRISQEVKRRVDKNQKEYYLREQIKAIRAELGETEQTEADAFLEKLAAKAMPDELREKLKKEIGRFRELPAGSHEQPQMRNYIECMLDLPWVEESEDNLELAHAREVLDADHYGLEKVKERILEHLAVARLTGKVTGQIICFVGPPGVGKTSVSESIAKAIGRKFVRMSLGGIHDEAEIRGHRRTYIGAMPGRIIAAMREAGTVNPVLLFDEIDKLTSDMRGDPASAMLEVLDSAQNHAFRDHFLEVTYDLSKVMFITTANSTDTIPRPLLDRMEVIEVPSYLENEKREIAKRHLLPKQMEKHGLKRSMLNVPDETMAELIRGYTREAGVRSLERTLAKVCRKAACEIGEGKTRVRLTTQRMKDYLGPVRYLDTASHREDLVGVVNGLAWTSVGGELLEVEVQAVPGSGQVLLTGKLGDVMQESARAALTYIKAHAQAFGITAALDKQDIHVHVPEGAVPKDGPSAGITMMTAITSALTGIPAKANVAMTGEITLRGRVLPIGGLREKLLAAARAGMSAVIIPEENKKDLHEVPEEVRDALKITFAKDAMQVLSAALKRMPKPQAQHEEAVMPLHVNVQGQPGAIQ